MDTAFLLPFTSLQPTPSAANPISCTDLSCPVPGSPADAKAMEHALGPWLAEGIVSMCVELARGLGVAQSRGAEVAAEGLDKLLCCLLRMLCASRRARDEFGVANGDGQDSGLQVRYLSM